MLARTSVTKRVRVLDKTFTIEGVAPDDHYFNVCAVDNFDPDFQRVCRMFIGPDDTCVDLGANIGLMALVMSQFGRRVVAAEGGPSIAAVLARNCASESNIETMHCAVSDCDGEAAFLERSAYGHLRDDGPVRVPTKRLATILAEKNIERLDFLKMDIEGSEPAVLRDALDCINAHRTIVYFEFNSFALLTGRTANPFDYAQWIVEHFSHVYLTRRGGFPLRRIGRGLEGAHALLQANLTEDSAVTDIVVTNAPERLVGRLDELERQLEEQLSRTRTSAAKVGMKRTMRTMMRKARSLVVRLFA